MVVMSESEHQNQATAASAAAVFGRNWYDNHQLHQQNAAYFSQMPYQYNNGKNIYTIICNIFLSGSL